MEIYASPIFSPKLEYYGKNVGNLAGRNPFKKSKKYDGYIYSIDYKLLPDCIRN